MSERRKLTADEKPKVLEYARHANPDAGVTIVVDDWIDEDGKVNWKTLAFTETILPHA